MNSCAIRDYADAFSGFAFSSNDLVDTGYPVLKIGNIQNHHILKETESFYCGEISEKIKKYQLRKDDFLLAMTGAGSVGRAGKMIDFEDGYLVNQRVAIIRPNLLMADPNYLFYYFSMSYVEQYLYNLGIGAGQPNISANDILKTKVTFPNLEKQKEIGAILSAYDELIENNNRRIALLEKAAQELYKEWFVRFRFPGYENAEFENGIPKGWEYVKLGEYANISTGKCNREDAEEDGVYPLFDRSQEIKKSSTWLKDCEAIIVPGEGTSFIPRYYKGKFNLHQRCYCVEPKTDKIGQFIYQTLMLNRIYFLYVATGATVPSLRQNNFTSMKILMPPINLVHKFEEIASIQVQKIDLLKESNENLTKQRDLLLPRLMSGKLEV